MFFYISKILSFLSSPLSWVFILILIAWRSKSAQRKKKFALLAVGTLYIFSNSFLIDEIFRLYEERDLTFLPATAHYDTAIILGGFSTYDPQSDLEGFHESSDRFMHGYKLLKQGIVDRVVISGGSGSILNKEEKEANIIQGFLQKIDGATDRFLFETKSKNTRENAIYTAQLLKENNLTGTNLLITSGYHMPRAKRCFEKVGIVFTPYSVDHYVGERRFDPGYLLIPNTGALNKWTLLIHEWVGYATYKLMGYI